MLGSTSTFPPTPPHHLPSYLLTRSHKSKTPSIYSTTSTSSIWSIKDRLSTIGKSGVCDTKLSLGDGLDVGGLRGRGWSRDGGGGGSGSHGAMTWSGNMDRDGNGNGHGNISGNGHNGSTTAKHSRHPSPGAQAISTLRSYQSSHKPSSGKRRLGLDSIWPRTAQIDADANEVDDDDDGALEQESSSRITSTTKSSSRPPILDKGKDKDKDPETSPSRLTPSFLKSTLDQVEVGSSPSGRLSFLESGSHPNTNGGVNGQISNASSSSFQTQVLTLPTPRLHTTTSSPTLSTSFQQQQSSSSSSSSSHLSPPSPNLPKPKPKPRSRAFENFTPLPPLDAALAAAEASSSLTRKHECKVCGKKGVNYPSCRKCGDTFCSRDCRVGVEGGGDGIKWVVAVAGLCKGRGIGNTKRWNSTFGPDRHICGVFEARELLQVPTNIGSGSRRRSNSTTIEWKMKEFD